METRARPTSRGRARCVSFRMGRWWEQTAAGPRAGACRLRRRALGDAALPRWGKGRCKCARSTLFALRAKALQSGAPDFGVSREKQGFGMFCPSGDFTGAPENGERADGPLHAGDGDTRRLADGTRPASRQPQAHHPPVANAALHKAHPNRHCFIPQTFPRGDRRALPAPAQGINPLRIPFWGTATAFPKMPQADGPCSWACRRLLAPPPQLDRNAARPPPTRGAGVRQHGAEGAGSRYYRTAASSAARPET